MTDLVRLPGASALPHWLLLPLLSQGGGLVAVTRALLAATGAVQHPDLHLDVTVTPESVTMVVMMVMVMSAALIMLVIMVVMMMVMDLLSGLLPHRGHVSPRALLCNNHPRTRVNPLHPERKRRETVVHHTKLPTLRLWNPVSRSLSWNPVSRSPFLNPVSPSWIASPVSYPSRPRLDYDYDSPPHVWGIAL